MSDQKQWPTIAGRGAQDDGAVESLLRLAGPREPVPADRMQRLKAGAHAEWRRQVATRRRRQVMRWSLGGLAAAAALVLALRATMGLGPASPAAVAFVLVESLGGNARLATDADAQRGAFLKVGDRLAVGPNRLSLDGGTATLRLPGGAAVWVDRGSALRVTADDVVELDGGAVYIDSGGTASLEVRTALGVVRDVGTKFEVRLTPAALRVRVRDGAVQVRRDQQQHDARPGDEIVLAATGAVTRRTVPVDGPEWRWTTGAALPFELEGRSLREFLDWIAGENGWQLKFADAAVEDKARTTTLHGSIQGLTPEQALAAVLPTSGVEHRLDGSVLSLRLGVGGRN